MVRKIVIHSIGDRGHMEASPGLGQDGKRDYYKVFFFFFFFFFAGAGRRWLLVKHDGVDDEEGNRLVAGVSSSLRKIQWKE
jgi:hypothetical protein